VVTGILETAFLRVLLRHLLGGLIHRPPYRIVPLKMKWVSAVTNRKSLRSEDNPGIKPSTSDLKRLFLIVPLLFKIHLIAREVSMYSTFTDKYSTLQNFRKLYIIQISNVFTPFIQISFNKLWFTESLY